ncbi:MAG: serine/threonine protein kinase [Myxococcales bacterium]|nr:serine/threonine protein kinase [Myxococcales bacterium]
MPRDSDANDLTMVERIDPLLKSVLDRRFHIDFRLAAGGFGAIYRATHIKSRHEVALKVLHPQLTTDAGVVARFRREGATMTTLRSPHTITAYELGEADDGTLYIVMELLTGESLFERFRSQGRFEWKRMVKIMRAICRSLEEAHGLGIVHRDLKPTNIHLERVGDDADVVKVLDFGIAKILRDSDFDSSDLTNAGQMIGTLDYMSPEQMVGGTCTGQSDIYTLGILSYEMIAGVRPFAEAKTAAAALSAILKTTPPPLASRVPVPEALDRIIARCLQRDPLKRYPDVATLGADLDQLMSGQDQDDVTRTVALDDVIPAPPERDSLDSVDATIATSGVDSIDSVDSVDSTIAMSPSSMLTSAETSRPKLGITSPALDASRPRPELARAYAPRERPPTPAPARPAEPHRRAPTSAPVEAPASVDPVTTAPPALHVFRRAQTPPPVGLPTAAPFKTTLPGAQMPPGAGGRTALPAPFPGAAPTPYPSQHPGFPPPSFQQPPGLHAPYAPQPIDDRHGSRPVLDPSQFPRLPPTPGPPGASGYPQLGAYDMAQIAAREAEARRFIWIVVLVVAAIVGIVAATQL